MSLLNTTITDDDSQGWNPETSSYYQIMMSIFGLVFVDDPFVYSPVSRFSQINLLFASFL